MFDDLEFRNRQGDGRNVIAVAVATILAIPIVEWFGWPAVYALAAGTVGFLAGRLTK